MNSPNPAPLETLGGEGGNKGEEICQDGAAPSSALNLTPSRFRNKGKENGIDGAALANSLNLVPSRSMDKGEENCIKWSCSC